MTKQYKNKGAVNIATKSKSMQVLVTLALLLALVLTAVFAVFAPNFAARNSNRSQIVHANPDANVAPDTWAANYFGHLVSLQDLPNYLTSTTPLTAADFADMVTDGRTQNYGAIYVDLFPNFTPLDTFIPGSETEWPDGGGLPVHIHDGTAQIGSQFASMLWRVVYFCPEYEIVTLWMAEPYRMRQLHTNNGQGVTWANSTARQAVHTDFSNAVRAHNPELAGKIIAPSTLPDTFWQNTTEHNTAAMNATAARVPNNDSIWLPSFREAGLMYGQDSNSHNLGAGGERIGFWEVSGGDRGWVGSDGIDATSAFYRNNHTNQTWGGSMGFVENNGNVGVSINTNSTWNFGIRPAIHLSLANAASRPATVVANWRQPQTTWPYDDRIIDLSANTAAFTPTGFDSNSIITAEFDAYEHRQIQRVVISNDRIFGPSTTNIHTSAVSIATTAFDDIEEGWRVHGGVSSRAWFTGYGVNGSQRIVVQIINRVESTVADSQLTITLTAYIEQAANIQSTWLGYQPSDANITQPGSLDFNVQSDIISFDAGLGSRMAGVHFDAQRGWTADSWLLRYGYNGSGIYLSPTVFSESDAIPRIISRIGGGGADIAEIVYWFGCAERRSINIRITVLMGSTDHTDIITIRLGGIISYSRIVAETRLPNPNNITVQHFGEIILLYNTPTNTWIGTGTRGRIVGVDVNAYRGSNRVLDFTNMNIHHFADVCCCDITAGNYVDTLSPQIIQINGVDALSIIAWSWANPCCCSLNFAVQTLTTLLVETGIGQEQLVINFIVDNAAIIRVDYTTGQHSHVDDAAGRPQVTQFYTTQVNYGSTLLDAMPANDPVHPGATFLGWNAGRCCCSAVSFDVSIDGSTVLEYPLVQVACCCDLRFHFVARWAYNTFTVNFTNTVQDVPMQTFEWGAGGSLGNHNLIQQPNFSGVTSLWGAGFSHWSLEPEGEPFWNNPLLPWYIAHPYVYNSITLYAVWGTPNPDALVAYFHIDHPSIDQIDISGTPTRAIRKMVYRNESIGAPDLAGVSPLLQNAISGWTFNSSVVGMPYLYTGGTNEIHFHAVLNAITRLSAPVITLDNSRMLNISRVNNAIGYRVYLQDRVISQFRYDQIAGRSYVDYAGTYVFFDLNAHTNFVSVGMNEVRVRALAIDAVLSDYHSLDSNVEEFRGRLYPPENLRVNIVSDERFFLFDRVDNAVGYTVEIQVSYQTASMNWMSWYGMVFDESVTYLQLASGMHGFSLDGNSVSLNLTDIFDAITVDYIRLDVHFAVRALHEYYAPFDSSAHYHITVEAPIPLDAPTALRMDTHGLLEWNGVANRYGYKVWVNGVQIGGDGYIIRGLSADIENYLLLDFGDKNVIEVQAVAEPDCPYFADSDLAVLEFYVSCEDCGEYPCVCLCVDCGHVSCICPCDTCDLFPCICCDYCGTYPCVCPCVDCGYYPCACPCDICGQNPCDLCDDCGLCDCNCTDYPPTATPTTPAPGPCGYYPCICGDVPPPPPPPLCPDCEQRPCQCDDTSGFANWLFYHNNWMWFFPVVGVVLLAAILVAVIVPVTKAKRRKAATQAEQEALDAQMADQELSDGKKKARDAINDAFSDLKVAGDLSTAAWSNRQDKGLESKAMRQLDKTDKSILKAEKLVDDFIKAKKELTTKGKPE